MSRFALAVQAKKDRSKNCAPRPHEKWGPCVPKIYAPGIPRQLEQYLPLGTFCYCHFSETCLLLIS